MILGFGCYLILGENCQTSRKCILYLVPHPALTIGLTYENNNTKITPPFVILCRVPTWPGVSHLARRFVSNYGSMQSSGLMVNLLMIYPDIKA